MAYAPNLRGDDSRPHRYRHMLRGSVEGVIGGGFTGTTGRASVDEDEKAADDVKYKYVGNENEWILKNVYRLLLK